MNNSTRIIFVAFNENSLGRRILNMMIEEKIYPLHVFMASESALRQFRKNGINRYIKNNGILNTFWRIYYRLTVRKDVKSASINNDSKLSISIKEICILNNIKLGYFDNINSPDFVKIIEDLKPDLIVLGGAPLIKKSLINLPTIGILNSHPGVLPEAKGMDVVSQSILDSIPLGATVFKVDEGIDSGPILLIEYLNENIIGLKLHEIEEKVEYISAVSMIKAIKIVLENNYSFVPQEKRGKVYKALNYFNYRKVVKKIK